MIGEPYPNLVKNSWIIPDDAWKARPDTYPPYIPQVPTITKPNFPMSEEEIRRMEKLIGDSRAANEAAKRAKDESDFKLLEELAKKFGYKLVKEKSKKEKQSGK